MLKELFPYKQYGGRYQFRYYVSFVEEGIMNPDYFEYTAGRCEVRVDESAYSIDEFRYLTKKKSFWTFRDYVECKYFNIIGLWLIKFILKHYYYDTIRKI
jgi:hypothetical protein